MVRIIKKGSLYKALFINPSVYLLFLLFKNNDKSEGSRYLSACTNKVKYQL